MSTGPPNPELDDALAEPMLAGLLERIPSAFAVTRDPNHTLVYANEALRASSLTLPGLSLGRSIADSIVGEGRNRLIELLDDAYRSANVLRNGRLATDGAVRPAWCCTIWPELGPDGRTEALVIELREESPAEVATSFQRDVAERMLVAALEQRASAEGAEASRRRSAYLAAEGRRIARSLDETATLEAVSKTSLLSVGSWCIVDVVHADGSMTRLTIVHADPAKRRLLRPLQGIWQPRPDDQFGIPAIQSKSRESPVFVDGSKVLASMDGDRAVSDVLREVGLGLMLTVPMELDGRLIGTITFVAPESERSFRPEDVVLAQDLAVRSAAAIENARVHGVVIGLKNSAEAAGEAKIAFLGSMSHELRTPLNAIAGYVDLLELGMHGPLSAEQRTDIQRIKHNQRHLLALITDVLNFVKIRNEPIPVQLADVSVADALAASSAVVEPLLQQKQLAYHSDCDPAVVVRADQARLVQILVNLISNAVKFTPNGGRLTVTCETGETMVRVHVSDTGIGIPVEKTEAIFEPFVQVRAGLAGRDTGVGLGLAISRRLARAMHGDITVTESSPGGSRITVELPRARDSSGPRSS